MCVCILCPMQAAGLSSSSAFVCCSSLATMYVNGGHLSKVLDIDPRDLGYSLLSSVDN